MRRAARAIIQHTFSYSLLIVQHYLELRYLNCYFELNGDVTTASALQSSEWAGFQNLFLARCISLPEVFVVNHVFPSR
jgi:hypothetical protein